VISFGFVLPLRNSDTDCGVMLNALAIDSAVFPLSTMSESNLLEKISNKSIIPIDNQLLPDYTVTNIRQRLTNKGGKAMSLRSERESRGWEQKQVAEWIGITASSLSSIELGQNKPSFDTLVKLEQLYGKTRAELFDISNKSA
jgi:DNA-binding XRE family transcriptional regulator